MTWFNKQINRIPERWRLLAGQYGVWLLLLAGVGLAWYFDSKRELVQFDEFVMDDARKGKNTVKSSGYVLGFVLAGLVKFPHRFLPMLAVVWALAILNYRYLFVRFAVNTDWKKKLAYGVILLGLRWVLIVAVTAWLGFDRSSGSLVNFGLVAALFYAFVVYFRRLRITRRQLTEQKTRAELDALKAQINPHFLFNSLNNIFGTALTENGPRTADSVQQLARILRYMLEQADTDRASVGAELKFLDEYVGLQKQRLTDQIATDVQFGYVWDEEPAQVAPLLLSPLLDYAFRRSTEAENGRAGFLHANASVQARQLQFVLDYTCVDCQSAQSDELQNVRQRLALIYPDCHRFTLREADTTAHLELTINLN